MRLRLVVALLLCSAPVAACTSVGDAPTVAPQGAAPHAARAAGHAKPRTVKARSVPARTVPATQRSRHRRVRAPVAGTAAAVLASLAVKGRAPMTGYDRDEFGQAWLDANQNGCDSRNDVLTRDLTARTYDAATHHCVVLDGDLADPYTRTRIHFERGDGTLVDIDHVVALGNAWASGAARWDVRRRAALANDPMNLLAVQASANRQKGDGDAATWLPANRSYRCAYVARQVSVKAKYRLSVTGAEPTAIRRVLQSCPGQPAAARSRAALQVPFPVSAPSLKTHERRGVRGRPQAAAGRVYYESCDAAAAAGAAPVHRGDPGYASHLDRDGDGSGCE
jgi:hypothetical protein